MTNSNKIIIGSITKNIAIINKKWKSQINDIEETNVFELLKYSEIGLALDLSNRQKYSQMVELCHSFPYGFRAKIYLFSNGVFGLFANAKIKRILRNKGCVVYEKRFAMDNFWGDCWMLVVWIYKNINKTWGGTKEDGHLTLDYDEYVLSQKEKYCSLESDSKLWKDGQKRFIDQNFSKISKSSRILDIACGDGVGLRRFREMGFLNVVGVEFNHVKAVLAKKSGYKIYEYDMQNLNEFQSNSFDVIYSSHTLEHAFDIDKVLAGFRRILKIEGKLIVVLPYPDNHQFNLDAHVAKFQLGTNKDDGGKSVINCFENNGFKLVSKKYDYFREPEIWLTLRK